MKTRFFISILFMLSANAFSQMKTPAAKLTVLEGMLAPDRNDSIHITLYRETFGRKKVNAESLSAKVHNGKFKFRIKGLDKIAYLQLPGTLFKESFLVEPGDSVFIQVSTGVLKFSGRNALKYECSYLTDSLLRKITASKKPVFITAAEIAKDVMSGLASTRVDSAYNLQMQMLQKYKASMSQAAFDVLKNDYYGSNKNAKIMRFLLRWWPEAFRLPDSIERKKKLIAFYKAQIADDTIHTSWSSKAVSEEYVDYILQRKLIEDLIRRNGRSAKVLLPLIQQLQEEYQHAPDLFREKLLTSFLIYYPRTNQDYAGCAEFGLKKVRNDSYRALITHFKNSYETLKPAYPFSFKDTAGNTVTLNDFKGKVLLLDFWFEGCSPCKMLTQRMKPVLDCFKDSAKVVFVNVYVDKDRDTWLRALKGGEYTDPSSLSLYTNGLGIGDPFLKFYNLTGCPKLILINGKGEVVSVTPPMPDGSAEVRDKLIDLIRRTIS